MTLGPVDLPGLEGLFLSPRCSQQSRRTLEIPLGGSVNVAAGRMEKQG